MMCTRDVIETLMLSFVGCNIEMPHVDGHLRYADVRNVVNK